MAVGRHFAPEPCKIKALARRRGCQAKHAHGSKLAVLPQYLAARTADPPTLRGEFCAAAEQVAPGHTAGSIAELRRGRLARRQFSEIDRIGARAPHTDTQAYGQHRFHAQKFLMFSLGGVCKAESWSKIQLFVHRAITANSEAGFAALRYWKYGPIAHGGVNYATGKPPI
ncbi:MAG TPA: hypothetical protein VEJ37_05040 [Xanthobacteraceae bacterium]|nr:hypothetical protein [Xanthobacteraceae bacterium]